MRHTSVKLMGLLIALMLALTGCNLIGIDPMMQLDEDFAKLDKDYATVVAQYDGGTVTKGDVIGAYASQYSYYAQMYSMFGMNMTADVAQSIKQQVLESEIQDIAIAKEFETRGLSLSEESLAEVQTKADDNYKQAFDTFYKSAEGKGEVKDRQTEYDMYANGYSKDLFYKSQLAQAKRTLFEETVKGEVSELTDEQVQKAYDDKVAANESAYADSPSAFESAMSSADEVVAWMPEGYRTVKHILVKPEEAVLTAVTDARTKLTDAETALSNYESELAALDSAEPAAEASEASETADEAAEPTEAPRTAEQIQADIDQAKATVEEAKKAVEDAEKACLDSVKEKTDAIYAALAEGKDFAELITEYNEDPGMQNEPTATRGYYVCAQKGNWDEHFNDGAMALQNVGDVSETPVISTSGVHIIRYESDVTPGAVPLEDIREALYNATLETAKDDHYTETLTAVTDALNPQYFVEAFNIA